ncbi:MAG: hypothetical protein ACE14V_05720 [bacterium]
MAYRIKLIPGIIVLILILPIIYLTYDRSLIPPAPTWTSPDYVPGETWEQYATRYLQISKQPNALEHYLNAFSSLTVDPYNKGWSSLRPILNSGWDKEYPEVEKLLTLNQKAIQEILTGTKLPYREFPPSPFGEKSPDFSVAYEKMQPLGNLIALAGKKSEHDSRFRDAMEFYLAGIKFGKEISQKTQYFNFMLNGISMMNTNARALLELTKSGKLPVTDYRQIIQELDKVEREQITYADEIEAMYREIYTRDYYHTAHPIQYYNELHPEAKGREFTGIQNYSKSYCVSYIYFNRGRILADDYNFFNDMLKSETRKSNPESTVNKMKVREPQNNYFNTKTITYLVAGLASLQREVTLLRLAQLEAAIQTYRLEKKQWPNSQDDLKSYLQPIPLDPYTDKPFLWTKNSANQPIIYSFGPDRADNMAKLVYDPTNGTISNGDIF